MIDTIKIVVMSNGLGNLKDFINNETKNKGKSFSPDTYYINGNIKNLKFSCRKDEDSFRVVIQGSIHKYYQGDNFSKFTFPDFEKALYDLIDESGIDLTKGVIRRLDFGINVKVNEVPSAYNLLLIESSDFKKDTWGNSNTVTLRKGRIHLSFYDKIKEMKASDKFKHFASIRKQKNILRYEIKLFKKLAYALHLKKSDLHVLDLLKHGVQKRLVRLWYREYNNINKNQLIIATSSFNYFFDYLAAIGIEGFGGVSNTMDAINSWCKLRRLDAQTKYSIKVRVRKFVEKNGVRNKLVDELNRKIRKAKNKVLSSI